MACGYNYLGCVFCSVCLFVYLSVIRYVEFYGNDPMLDYRTEALYDIILDTSANSSVQTFEQVLERLFAFIQPRTGTDHSEHIIKQHINMNNLKHKSPELATIAQKFIHQQ